MRIISTPLPAEVSTLMGGRSTIVMALDTLVDEKSLVVGLTEGIMQGPDLANVRVSTVGQVIIDRCARHHQVNYPNAPTVVAGVAQIASAEKRVRNVLTKAPPGAFVLLLCANGKIYDAAHTVLGVQFQSPDERAQ